MEGGALSSAIQRMRMTEKQIAYVVKQVRFFCFIFFTESKVKFTFK